MGVAIESLMHMNRWADVLVWMELGLMMERKCADAMFLAAVENS